MLASGQVAGLYTVLLRRPDSWRDVMLCMVLFLIFMRVLVEEQFRNISSLLFRLTVRAGKLWVLLSKVESCCRSSTVGCDRLRCDLRDGLVSSTLYFIRLSRESGDFQNP